MKFLDRNTLKLDKVLNELDIFVLDFIKILEKHTEYVIISGYVSLLFGRARSTEDIDIFIRALKKDAFVICYKELKEKGYWCLNAEEVNTVYDYLESGAAVRFARQEEVIPNFEVKFAQKPLQRESFKDRLKVLTTHGELMISSFERQIAFKRYHLKSEKDLEDAEHLEQVFKEKIDFNKVEQYKRLIEEEHEREKNISQTRKN